MKNNDLIELKNQAIELMSGNEHEAEKWLNTPSDILGNQTPLDHATTKAGYKDVLTLIARIRHGVFS